MLGESLPPQEGGNTRKEEENPRIRAIACDKGGGVERTSRGGKKLKTNKVLTALSGGGGQGGKNPKTGENVPKENLGQVKKNNTEK